jgi:hypothetical protein
VDALALITYSAANILFLLPNMLEMKPRASDMPGKCYTAELYHQSQRFLLKYVVTTSEICPAIHLFTDGFSHLF